MPQHTVPDPLPEAGVYAGAGAVVFFRGLQRRVQKTIGELGDGGHHFVVGILDVTLMRRVDIQSNSRREKEPREEPGGDPAGQRVDFPGTHGHNFPWTASCV